MLALISGLFITCLSVTGALLVYAKDIQILSQPDKWQVSSQDEVLPLSRLMSAVETETGQPFAMLMPETDPQLAWQGKLAND